VETYENGASFVWRAKREAFENANVIYMCN